MSSTRLWFPLVAPPLAFGAEGAFGWWAGAKICTSLSIGSVRALIGVVTIAMLVVALVGLSTGVNSYRAVSATHHAAADRVEFMAFAGVLVSTSFVVGLIWFGLNAVFINVCGGMR
jgi:hypothetical protein